MTRKAKRAVAITMLSIILIGLAFCIAGLAVSSVNGTTFTATVTEWWGVVVKAFSPGADKPGTDKPGIDNPGTDNPGEDNSGEGATAVCYDENGNELKPGVRYAFQNSLNFAEARGASNPEGGITITASIIPASALDKRVNWSVEWVDSSSEWAKGKTVTDYVTVTADETDSRIATVNCLAPFGSQIKVVATSAVNEQAKANCYVDYYKKGEDIAMELVAQYLICPTSNYPNASEVSTKVVYDDIFTRIDKNQYSMRYLDVTNMDTPYTCVYGIEYTEKYVDNSIGTKEGLKNIYLKNCMADTQLAGEIATKYKEASRVLFDEPKNTHGGTELYNYRVCRESGTLVKPDNRERKGPTIDSLNIKNCLGATFNDSSYEAFARTLLAITESGKYHYNYFLEATDVLTGEQKSIKIKVRLDNTFIPQALRVELDKNSVGF